MKSKSKSPVRIDTKLLNAFKDIYPEGEMHRAVQDAKKAFQAFKRDPSLFHSQKIRSHA